MSGAEYAAYLLKNYNSLKNELYFMEQELDSRKKNAKNGVVCRFAGIIVSFSQSRYDSLSTVKLNNTINLISSELSALDKALSTLDKSEQGLLRDLYIHRITWIKTAQKWYLSEPTISRHRKKALDAIGRIMGSGMSDTAGKVLTCAKAR